MIETRVADGLVSRSALGLVVVLSLPFTACSGSSPTGATSTPTGQVRAIRFTELAFNGAGQLFASDCHGGYVYKIGGSGELTVVAGTGLTDIPGLEGEGGPAIKAQVACPYGITFDRNGELVFADHANNRIRRIGHDGAVHTIAGSGPLGAQAGSFGGDGGPAIQANLQAPVSVLYDMNGNLYIGDRDNGAIRRVDPRGTITTFAGTGSRGYSADGRLATRTLLDQPEGMVFDAAGNLVLVDSANDRIRRIDARGIMTTIAGTGVRGYSGDGGPAILADMQPDDIAFDAAGNLYLAEFQDHAVRVIDAKGIIKPVAGTGKAGCSGYGGAAVRARVTAPLSPVFDSKGVLYFTDQGCGVVLRVDSKGIISVVAGSPH